MDRRNALGLFGIQEKGAPALPKALQLLSPAGCDRRYRFAPLDGNSELRSPSQTVKLGWTKGECSRVNLSQSGEQVDGRHRRIVHPAVGGGYADPCHERIRVFSVARCGWREPGPAESHPWRRRAAQHGQHSSGVQPWRTDLLEGRLASPPH